MPKKNGIISAVLAAAVVGVAPGVAEAHHVDSGSAKCELVSNVPTITATANFVGFTLADGNVTGALKIDGTTVQTVTIPKFSGNKTWTSAPQTATPGKHHVNGTFTWPTRGAMPNSFDADVVCPAPVTPPAPPTPPVAPPAPPAPPATPPTPPAVTPPAPPSGGILGQSDSSKKCVADKLGKYRITVTPKGRLHGLVTFHLQGKGATDVRWFVDTRRAAKTNRRWEWLSKNGRHYSIYLWAQQRWGEHLWGRHTIEAKFTVKDSCGVARAVRVTKLYFNHDPLPNDPIFAH